MLNDSKVEANIPASDIGRARDFYADKLGLTPASELPGRRPGLPDRPAAPPSRSTRPTTPDRPGTPSPSGTSQDIESEVRDLKAKGVAFEIYDDMPGVRVGRRDRVPGGHGPRGLVQGQRGQHDVPGPGRADLRRSAPDLLGGLDDQRELGDLLVAGERVALDRRGEAALPRQRQLLERHEPRRLVDPPLEVVLALQLAAASSSPGRARPACPAARTAAARSRRSGRRRTRGRSRRPPGRRTAPRRRSRSRPRPPTTTGSCRGTCAWSRSARPGRPASAALICRM